MLQQLLYQLKVKQNYCHNWNQVLKEQLIGWNKFPAKLKLLRQNPNLNHLVEPSFQGVNKLFVLAFENDAQRTSSKRYYLQNVEINHYDVMIDGENFFDQPIKYDKGTYENIRKIVTSQRDNYTFGCLLDYTYFKGYYEMIAVDLIKQQTPDADRKAIQQTNFTANFSRAVNAWIYFIFEEGKETTLEISQGTAKCFECNFIEMCYWMI